MLKVKMLKEKAELCLSIFLMVLSLSLIIITICLAISSSKHNLLAAGFLLFSVLSGILGIRSFKYAYGRLAMEKLRKFQ